MSAASRPTGELKEKQQGPTKKVIAVIPSRFGATRLPGKPLEIVGDRPMVQWVYERVSKAKGIAEVIVATDDERIRAVVMGFGGKVLLTSPTLASGTDRMAAVADQTDGDVYINIQGDEPLIEPGAVEAVKDLILEKGFEMATLMAPFRDQAALKDPAVVKVLASRKGHAIYFSRHPIPYSRGPLPEPGGSLACRRHLGIYAFRRETLFRFRAWPASPLETGEVLEQLRALENDVSIGISEFESVSFGVDTPEDLKKMRDLWQSQRSLFL